MVNISMQLPNTLPKNDISFQSGHQLKLLVTVKSTLIFDHSLSKVPAAVFWPQFGQKLGFAAPCGLALGFELL